MARASADDVAAAASNEHDVMNVGEVASFLRVGRNQIYALVACDEIPHRRVGKHLRFSRDALVRWLSSCGQLEVAKKGHR